MLAGNVVVSAGGQPQAKWLDLHRLKEKSGLLSFAILLSVSRQTRQHNLDFSFCLYYSVDVLAGLCLKPSNQPRMTFALCWCLT